MIAVSVVMPVKNAESTLKLAVDSILSQSFTNFELIIIDNNSNDSSVSIINSFNDKRIVLIQNPVPGLVSTLNLGIEHASGEFIARMDADDVALKERLAQQIKFMDDHPDIGVVSCLVEHLPTNGNQQGYALHVEHINSILTPEQHFINRFIDAPVAHPSVLLRKNLVSEFCGYIEEEGPEDYELWLRWLQSGVLFAKVPTTLLQWRDDPNRLSRVSDLYSKDKFYALKAKYFAEWWKINSNCRKLWIWGYGQTVYKRSNMLADQGVSIYGFIDVKNHAHSTRNVINYKEYKSSMGFILVYVSDRNGKFKIEEYLASIGCLAGQDYYFMS